MEYRNSLQIELSKSVSLVLIFLFAIFFISYCSIVFFRLYSEHLIAAALDFTDEAKSLEKAPIEYMSLSYQKALKSLHKSMHFNALNSKTHFENGEIVREISDGPEELRVGIDIRKFGASEDGLDGFYNLSKISYIQAILREPTNAIYHQRLGDTYLKLSDIKSAEKEFDAALLLDPQNAAIHLYLSNFYFFMNMQDKFIFHLNKAMDLGDEAVDGNIRGANYKFLKSIGRLDLYRSKYR